MAMVHDPFPFFKILPTDDAQNINEHNAGWRHKQHILSPRRVVVSVQVRTPVEAANQSFLGPVFTMA